jgi:hypothetical protein
MAEGRGARARLPKPAVSSRCSPSATQPPARLSRQQENKDKATPRQFCVDTQVTRDGMAGSFRYHGSARCTPRQRRQRRGRVVLTALHARRPR